MEYTSLTESDHILEPSAGQGHIGKWIKLFAPNSTVDVCELVPAFYPLLKSKGLNLIGSNFIELPVHPAYDLVIANPPFGRQMTHIKKMYRHLKPKGRIVTVASARYRYETTNRQGLPAAIYSEFRAWLKSVNAIDIPLPLNSFGDSERSTNVETCLLIIDKP